MYSLVSQACLSQIAVVVLYCLCLFLPSASSAPQCRNQFYLSSLHVLLFIWTAPKIIPFFSPYKETTISVHVHSGHFRKVCLFHPFSFYNIFSTGFWMLQNISRNRSNSLWTRLGSCENWVYSSRRLLLFKYKKSMHGALQLSCAIVFSKSYWYWNHCGEATKPNFSDL